MTKKKRRGRRHMARVSVVRLTQKSTALHMPELSRPSQVIERSSLTKAGEPAERHCHVAAELKRIAAIGGTLFVMLIVLYLLLG